MHATEAQLALFGTGELGLAERLRVRWHVSHCEECSRELAGFEEARAVLEAEAAPGAAADANWPNANWQSLAQEMTANIRLGVEAGECVRHVAEPVTANGLDWSGLWRPALAIASAVVVLYAGTWFVAKKMTQGGLAAQQTAASHQLVLEARPDALEIRGNGAAFALVRASTGEALPLSVGAGESMAARDIDEDTGQVTIYHVYAQ